MDLYRVGMPEDNDIIVRDKFIINKILPLCIKKISEDQYSLLFYTEQDSTETSIFLQSIIKFEGNEDEGFLNNHPLNITTIQRNPDRLSFYNEKISNMSGNVFNTDFDMEEDKDNKRFFRSKGIKALNLKDGNTRASLLDLYITRDNFIKINLFITKFLMMDYSAESVFTNRKLTNVEFLKVDYVKLNGSTENKPAGIVYSNYYLGLGPTNYRMNFLSPIIEDRQLVNPILPNSYEIYLDDFTISDIICDAHQDRIYVLYEVRNSVNTYMKTVVLVLDKKYYDHTNFVELDKVYEKENKNNIKIIL